MERAAMEGIKGKAGFWLAVLSLAVLIWGIAQGEAGRVMIKGINICLECIGLR